MKKFTIYLNEDFGRYMLEKNGVNPEKLTAVAEVEAHDETSKGAMLEEVFHKTQNIYGSWVDAEGIENIGKDDQYRSLSVGDVVKNEDATYVVEVFGFKEIELDL